VDGKIVSSFSKLNCAAPSCVSGSINAGQSKVTINSQCCNNTVYCITQPLSDLPKKSPNGNQCFTCNMTDCSKMLACEGDETQCFTATVYGNDGKVPMKGCSSRQLCGINGTQTLGLPAPLGAAVTKCCQGNLCNQAQSPRAYFPILIALLSLFLF
ncbi:sperm acrosome membrane-associated protein 4, partial [Danio aesculapii]|uniref:sperm acrosome membrane-associated protein 4 n=1 Tax=Danio aesculapii TaxID=1142201 RepID=UPI0024BFD8F5